MVVFTCGHCGDSVQKPKVEKHYLTKCRNKNPNLSCMDCFKDFLGDDYEGHTKCITEEERYSGKGFIPKEKKGEKKQNAWLEMLQSVLDEQKNASRNVLRIIETISKHNNTPRKKPKFINFVKNVCGHKTNPKDIDQAWDLISVKLAALSNYNAQNRNQNQKDKTDEKLNGLAVEEQNESTTNDKTENGDTNHEKDEEEPEAKEGEKNEEIQTGETEQTNKKLSKKQRKEEKKRKKYEAELLSAEAPEITQEEELPKKGKKNKNKTENTNGHDETNSKDKNKKRKRQDTANTVDLVAAVNGAEIENLPEKAKAIKKKLKMEGELDVAEGVESVCLHDQNVANSEKEVLDNNGKFNWHAVIMSVLKKKGNELPFKRLQKKVLSEYSEFSGCEVDDRIADKFIKKLKSAPNVRVDKNRVLLLEDEE